MDVEKLKKNLVKGAPARLFPVLPDSRKEEKATSILLSTFSVIPEFSQAILEEAGATVGKRSQIFCFTEVSFRGVDSKSRPDGLIVLQNGKKSWVALVESKIGRAELSAEQVEEYLDIARAQGFDAVITISNQFAAIANHHPVRVNKQKTRSVGLYHFSWTSILSKALLLIDNKRVSDVEQAFLLNELVRYLKHESSGITTPLTLGSAWRDTCDEVLRGNDITKSSDQTMGTVGDWFQLLRFLSIQLTLATGQPCSIKLTRKHESDPQCRLNDNAGELAATQQLTACVDIPNAATDVQITLNFERRTLKLSASLDAPQDVKQQRAAISFVTNQVKHLEKDELTIKVNWPRRTKPTELEIGAALDEYERKKLISPTTSELPSSVEIIRLIDLGAIIKSSGKMPVEAEVHLNTFYRDVVQNLRRHVPKAPKIKESTEKSTQQNKSLKPSVLVTDPAGDDAESTLTLPHYFFMPPKRLE